MVYDYLRKVVEEKGAGYLVLLDPEKLPLPELREVVSQISEGGADGILVGGSTLYSGDFEEFVSQVKARSELPVIVFPGGAYQISRSADAILFLSLISGRNPQYLIAEQVSAAPLLKKYGIETIPVGYMLIESGNPTSVQFISSTLPIPREKTEIAVSHALAAEYLGMRMVYLDGGSGARSSVPDEMIRAVRDAISVPIIVGGGIRNPEEASLKVASGASFVVTGSATEEEPSVVRDFARAIHRVKGSASRSGRRKR